MPDTTDPVALLPERFRPLILPCLTLPKVTLASARRIFGNLDIDLTDIPVFFESVRGAGLCEDEDGAKKARSDQITFTNEVRYSILMQVKAEDFRRALEVSEASKSFPRFVDFLNNVLEARDGLPITPQPGFKTNSEAYDYWRGMAPHFNWLFMDDRGPRLENAFGLLMMIHDAAEVGLYMLFLDKKLDLAKEATVLPNLSAVQRYFLRQPDFKLDRRKHDFFELQFRFTCLGDPAERMAAMLPDTSEYAIMQAVSHLSAGRHADALKSMRTALKRHGRDSQDFSDPLTNLLYGVTLWHCRRMPTAKKTIRQLLENLYLHWSPTIPLTLFLLAADSDFEDPYRNIEWFEYDDCPPTRTAGLIALAYKAIHRNAKLPESYEAAYAKCRRDMAWFDFEASALESGSSPEFEDARKRLGMEPVIANIGARPAWKNTLEELIDLEDEASGKLVGARPTVSKTVLAFHITLDFLDACAWLRKTKDGEHFTQGKFVRHERVAFGDCEAATAHDRKVAAMARRMWTCDLGNGVFLLGPEVMRELMGHPHLFDAREPDRRVTIQPADLTVSVHTQEDGSLKLETNVPVDQIENEYECYACRLDETTIGVIEPTPVQKEFLTMFFMESGANVLPAEAGDMLRTLLAKMLPAAATSEKC